MASLKANEGYMMVDHRMSPGIPEDLEAYWITQGKLQPGDVVRGGAMLETGIKCCNHCQRVILLNPQRQRDRHTCLKCYAYVCDQCYASGECIPIWKVLDDLQNAAEKALAIKEL